MDETGRIRKVYANRNNREDNRLYSYFNPSALFVYQEREKAILEALNRIEFVNMADKRILDVGCGTGGLLRDFVRYGAAAENCVGIDLLPDRIEQARKISPCMDFRCDNAEHLPFSHDFFDIVLCSTVFSSVLDKDMKRNIANEMIRVVNTAGLIIWFDYHFNNPKNPDVRGVKKKEIYDLFQNCDIKLKRIIPAPPLLRIIAPHSTILCYLLQKLKIFNTHYLGVIRKVEQTHCG